MKFPKFKDTLISSPYQNPRWGKGWYIDSHAAIGSETVYGPYRTRQRARKARRGLQARAQGSGSALERKFWNP